MFNGEELGFLILSVGITIGFIWALHPGVDMWVSHWNIFFIIPVSMTYTGAIIILR